MPTGGRYPNSSTTIANTYKFVWWIDIGLTFIISLLASALAFLMPLGLHVTFNAPLWVAITTSVICGVTGTWLSVVRSFFGSYLPERREIYKTFKK